MKRTKSTLSLIEQIIVIAVFAFCAAVCVNIIVSSYLMTVNAVDTRNALTVAESAAESFKAFEGDTERVFRLLGEPDSGYATHNVLVIYYDANWQPSRESDASFVLRLTTVVDNGSAVVFASISVIKIDDGVELISLTVAARRGGGAL